MAIPNARSQKAPLSYFSPILGLMTLTAMLLYIPDTGSFGTAMGISIGGLEKLIVYPVLFWAISFAGHLIGMEDRLSI
jgi:hypothetical protein